VTRTAQVITSIESEKERDMDGGGDAVKADLAGWSPDLFPAVYQAKD
jgi:hypothetical protein